MVVFDRQNYERGQYVEVIITSANSATLLAEPVRATTIYDFYSAAVTA